MISCRLLWWHLRRNRGSISSRLPWWHQRFIIIRFDPSASVRSPDGRHVIADVLAHDVSNLILRLGKLVSTCSAGGAAAGGALLSGSSASSSANTADVLGAEEALFFFSFKCFDVIHEFTEFTGDCTIGVAVTTRSVCLVADRRSQPVSNCKCSALSAWQSMSLIEGLRW